MKLFYKEEGSQEQVYIQVRDYEHILLNNSLEDLIAQTLFKRDSILLNNKQELRNPAHLRRVHDVGNQIAVISNEFTQPLEELDEFADSNRDDFISFDNFHIVKLFRRLEFIPDFDQFKYLNSNEMLKIIETNKRKMMQIKDIYPNLPEHDRMIKQKEYSETLYLIQELNRIYHAVNGKYSVPFPDFVEIPEKRENLLKKMINWLSN